MVQFFQGEVQLGRQTLDQALAVAQRNLNVAFTFQTQAQQLQTAAMSRKRLGMALLVADDAGIPADELYGHVLALKGAVYAHQRRIRQARENPAAQPILRELSALNRELAALFHHAARDEPSGQWSARVGELTQTKNRLEQIGRA